MDLDKGKNLWLNTNNQNENNINSQIGNIKNNIYDILNPIKNEIISKLEKEKINWYSYNIDTLNALFKKYHNLSIEDFEKYFLVWIYNKNILSCSPWIIDLLDLEKITPWDDLIEYIINKISITKEVFNDNILNLNLLTFPNLTRWDVAQWYFFNKLQTLLPHTKIISWDDKEIKENIWKNQFNTDSVWFIDFMWEWLFNTCLLKLLKTPPNQEKIDKLNELFKSLEKDIFIWWSTFTIPFDIPSSLSPISMPKWSIDTSKRLKLLPNWTLINSMWYLNSAFYADKVKASFVLWSHNIAEPMHAWKLTVINDDPKNRYNHNWLISYFWEKSWLLHYMEKSKEQNQEAINNFLEISKEELQKRYKKFQELYEEKIIPLVYGILHNYLKNSFNEIKK